MRLGYEHLVGTPSGEYRSGDRKEVLVKIHV